MFDRQTKVGRIQRSFGTDDRDTIEGIKTMVKTLEKTGQWKVLEGIQAGKVSLLEVYSKWHTQDLKSVLVVEGAMDFETTATSWVTNYDNIIETTRDGYKYHFAQLLKIRSKFTVQDAPEVLALYRKQCAKRGTGRLFNMTRNSLRSFFRNTFDEFHILYAAVVKIRPLKEEATRKEKAWTVADVREVIAKMRPDVGAMFWTMCLTGVGWKEYQHGLTIEGNGIRIKGEKMTRIDNRRNRLVPFIEPPAPMVIKEKRFRIHLSEASGKRFQIYDARRCFKVWMRDAGVTFENVSLYMGHRPRNMTDRYSNVEMTAFLDADATKFKAYLSKHRNVKPKVEEPKKPLRIMPEVDWMNLPK